MLDGVDMAVKKDPPKGGKTAPKGDAQEKASSSTTRPSEQPLDKIQAVGHAVWLMTQSPIHKHLLVSELEWLLIPAVAHGQFRLWRHNNRPVGFLSWAFVNEEVEARIKSGQVKLMPQEWKCGDKVWLIDTIFPYGGNAEAVEELKREVFAGREVNAVETMRAS